jgi:hypothetical protein
MTARSDIDAARELAASQRQKIATLITAIDASPPSELATAVREIVARHRPVIEQLAARTELLVAQLEATPAEERDGAAAAAAHESLHRAMDEMIAELAPYTRALVVANRGSA